MVSSQDCDSVLEANFESDEERHSLHRVISSINIVAHEEIVCVWKPSSKSEQLFEIMELAMDVSTDGDWCTNWLDVDFFY